MVNNHELNGKSKQKRIWQAYLYSFPLVFNYSQAGKG